MPSGEAWRGWLPRVASVARVIQQVDPLDSAGNPLWPGGPTRKFLKLSQNFERGSQGGFQVDSPVKRPDARKLARSAPPYTDRAQEEPCRG
jgi:hypothetical protein